jgi:hypothetical protein
MIYSVESPKLPVVNPSTVSYNASVKNCNVASNLMRLENKIFSFTLKNCFMLPRYENAGIVEENFEGLGLAPG